MSNVVGLPRGVAAAYVERLRAEFPRLRIVDKAGDRWSNVLDRLLRIATFGAQRSYLTQYVTTLGQTIYVPSNWESRPDVERYLVLRHEAVHLRQFKRYTFAGMAIVYLLPIFPLGFALGRAWLEWEAYAETLRAVAETHGIEAARSPQLTEHIVRQFTSGAYGWMWPFARQVRGWVNRELQVIEEQLRA